MVFMLIDAVRDVFFYCICDKGIAIIYLEAEHGIVMDGFFDRIFMQSITILLLGSLG